MARLAYIGVFAALLSTQSSCTSFDLEEEEALGAQSQQISAQDSIVLCPVVAAVEPNNGADLGDAEVSVVWAGYPPDDDRLQLMRARVSAQGKMLSLRSVAFLDGDLTALDLRTGSDGLELEFVDSELGELRVLRLSENRARELDASASEEANWSESAWSGIDSDARCQTSVVVGSHELTVFRGQADGGLSLFVQSVLR